MKRIALLSLAFMAAFASVSAYAQGTDDSIDPRKVVTKTEAQYVRETICAAMQDDETYKPKHMVVYKKIVAGDDGWVFRTGTDFRTDFSLHPQTIKYMKKLQDAFTKLGTTFIYLIPPTRGLANGDHATPTDPESKEFLAKRDAAQASYHNMLKSYKAAGINAIGFSDLDSGKDYFYKRDHHWNPEGAKLAASRTADFIKTLPVYASLKKTPYITKDKGTYDYSGPFGEILEPICKLSLMSEKTHKFETEIVTTANASQDLFEDKGFPEVVLVGTSNSASDPSVANFEGFLKEALQTDIYNASIVGAGIDAPILAYLNSEAFRQHKPKIVIWETPGYYNQNVMHSRIYRQAIPAVIGDCEGKALAETKGIKLDQAKIRVLKGLDGKKLQGSQYYLALRFSKAVKKPIILSFEYKNWADTYKTTRPPRYPYDGEFYMLMKDTRAGSLQSIDIEVPEDLIGETVDARMCIMPASLVGSNTAATATKTAAAGTGKK